MRLDPKYFNLFIAICALLTLIVIVYGTISYSNNQEADFRKSLSEARLDTLSFVTYSAGRDTLHITDIQGKPTVIHFWSTWSDKSLDVHQFLESYHREHSNLTVIAAAVRDSDELIRNYIDSVDNNFIYVEGTSFFQSLLVPGMPSQILLDEDGKFFDSQVGDDTTALKHKLDRLNDEQ
jgi:thiol-disulfide isomerase/thioredoxin